MLIREATADDENGVKRGRQHQINLSIKKTLKTGKVTMLQNSPSQNIRPSMHMSANNKQPVSTPNMSSTEYKQQTSLGHQTPIEQYDMSKLQVQLKHLTSMPVQLETHQYSPNLTPIQQ